MTLMSLNLIMQSNKRYIEMPKTTRRRTMQNQMDLFSFNDDK